MLLTMPVHRFAMWLSAAFTTGVGVGMHHLFLGIGQ
jgi:hypothetical protein